MKLANDLAALHLSPITALPVELLAGIFTHLEDRSDILRCSHVCKFWNSVSIGCKELWIDIPIWSFPLTKLFLERSDPAPIFVDIEGPVFEREMDYREAVSLALQHLPRIEVLKWEAVDSLESKTTLELLATQPASALRFLDMSIHRGHGRLDLPLEMFAGTPPPRLKHLYLQFCNSSHAFPPFHCSSLTVLHLTYCNIHRTVDDVLDTLSLMPSLEEVYIDGSHHVSTPPPSSRWSKRRALAMRSVRSFRLLLDIMVASMIVSRLRLPHDVGLEMTGRASGQSVLEEVAQTVTEHCAMDGGSEVIPFKKVFVIRGAYWNVIHGARSPDATSWRSTDYHSPRYPAGDPYKQGPMSPGVAVRIPRPRSDEEDKNLETFLDGLAICTRTSWLSVSIGEMAVGRAFWRRMSAFERVEVLELACRAAWEVFFVFNQPISPDPHQGDADLPPLFPNVHTVRLVRVDLMRDDDERPILREQLWVFIQEFGRYWPRFGELRIENCVVTEEVVDSLRERLGEQCVVWDGRCGRAEDDEDGDATDEVG